MDLAGFGYAAQNMSKQVYVPNLATELMDGANAEWLALHKRWAKR